MRKKLIAGNWKMHKTSEEAMQFLTELKQEVPNLLEVSRNTEIAIAAPSILLGAMRSEFNLSGVKVLAQNCHWEKQGAFTGELSVPMLLDFKISGSLVGHSERRQYFGEADKFVGLKWNALVAAGLLPIICIGETRVEREKGETNAVLRQQLDGALSQVSEEMRTKEFVIAYEPVWAIGTGLTATPDQAQDAHSFIRSHLQSTLNRSAAESTRILYGGSMNAANAKELLTKPDIDGGLIGGASLKAADFAKIIKSAE